MAEDKKGIVNAVVNRKGYHYRRNPIPVGRVVRMTQEQWDETQQTQPSYFREAKRDEMEKADTILDLATVSEPKAANVEAAEAGATPKSPSSRGRG